MMTEEQPKNLSLNFGGTIEFLKNKEISGHPCGQKIEY